MDPMGYGKTVPNGFDVDVAASGTRALAASPPKWVPLLPAAPRPCRSVPPRGVMWKNHPHLDLENPWKKIHKIHGFEMTYIFVASRPTTSHNSMFPHWAPRASPENLGTPTDRVPELSSSNDKKICRSFSMVSSEICREPNSGRNGAMITPEVLNLI